MCRLVVSAQDPNDTLAGVCREMPELAERKNDLAWFDGQLAALK
jgi:hypothetical protein